MKDPEFHLRIFGWYCSRGVMYQVQSFVTIGVYNFVSLIWNFEGVKFEEVGGPAPTFFSLAMASNPEINKLGIIYQ